ncbi:MAG: hypothetical protein IPJ48_10170 [Propionivibrio sp.]|uniref:Uncharacterized protein n=1 Tax=Candidatus Propionivibrio dominans TaxID=2954373 RepID=A0A9D7I7L9_9RHOO|nr:hypothetical protein [Candidatus Propionivibrio dominans]MBL0168773.1 hypothetical protein [Propionivibrio sp.]
MPDLQSKEQAYSFFTNKIMKLGHIARSNPNTGCRQMATLNQGREIKLMIYIGFICRLEQTSAMTINAPEVHLDAGAR